MDKQLFRNPTAPYRPLPFWAWNDRLEPRRIREQIRHMHAVGLGGFFMHSRQGLVTPYLSEEWMEAVAAALNEADKVGMEVWLYDEDRYPSGTAGGRALECNFPEFAAKHLIYEDEETPGPVEGTLLARFAYRDGADGRVEVRILRETESLAAGERCLTFYWDTASPSTWFNGFTYLDTLDEAAVRSFITHGLEPYRQRFARDFGGRIPGIFTDEPQMFSVRTGPATSTFPWTKRFPIEFRRRRGYDLLEKLAYLVLPVKDSATVRYDFWRTATELFLETWCRLISHWCEANGLGWTGHCWEHEFPYFHKCGSFMAPLAYFHIPGIDLLGRRTFIGKLPGDKIQHQMGNVQMVKLASSVAHQTGRKRVLSETYGGAMSDISFADQKIMADWECALGVNLLNPHLYHYSLRGLRKRDYPPSWGAHQPWSHVYKCLADYFGRLCYALSEGEFVANIAVLHPVTVLWVEGFGRQDIARSFEDLCKDLTEGNWDYDLADEMMMESMATVNEGQLRIGDGRYDILILPAHTVLAAPTVDLLEELVATGGNVVSLATAPRAVKPEDAKRLEKLLPALRVAADWSALEAWLRQHVSRTVSITLNHDGGSLQEEIEADHPRPRIYSHTRRLDDNFLVFLANVGERDCPEATVTVYHPGPVATLDLFSGKILPVNYTRSEDGVKVKLSFLQAESHLLLVGEKAAAMVDDVSSVSDIPKREVKQIDISQQWRVRPLDANPLVLDYCRYRIGGGEWSQPMPVWEAYTCIRRYYGLDTSLSNRDVQPWRKMRDRSPLTASEPIDIELVFAVENLEHRSGSVKLVVESGERYTITVNGKECRKPIETWLDPAFQVFDITAALVEGENSVVLTTTFSEDLELENSFVLGDFTVRPGAIGKPNTASFPAQTTLGVGDWTRQGYPFYAGQMEYTCELYLTDIEDKQALLSIKELMAQHVAVEINGENAGEIFLPPYKLDITEWIRPGKNTLRLVLTNSLRNLLDPLHYEEAKEIAGPEMFSDRNNWQDEYNLAPQGIDGTVIEVLEVES